VIFVIISEISIVSGNTGVCHRRANQPQRHLY